MPKKAPVTGKVLPPLDYLLAFEAAAKAQSFAQASKVLNISETAISRKVRLLEQHYDVPLFVRGHRSVSLTQQGAILLATVEKSLDLMRDVSRDMLAKHQANTVSISATNSVASLWLMPQLRKFNKSNGRIRISLVSSDSDAECLSDSMDLTILRGDGGWPGYEAKLLFGETVFPVCSPEYLKSNPNAADLSALPELDLIEVTSGHAEWMTWRAWFSGNGVSTLSMEQAVAFNTYPLSVQAAVDGLGIALGWAHLVDPLLESGALVRPVQGASVRTESGYYLLKRPFNSASPEQLIVEDWLLGLSAGRKRYA
ncbi:LysR substrate-binding domain-containing protein [Ruegeria sp. A3M17]|uniref:LysR substrate-binding domain-containing protein n=1 Tax=Ruegeria sp. A3M17 TaxID=2267229 RepID=UPI000DEBA499|nr:LysR substrate-binding domain-containing protein [Ruegeria sp. A3M17]RBW62563.1 LysR family transcriptional regulator [Ruegeria sp. A3M17]